MSRIIDEAARPIEPVSFRDRIGSRTGQVSCRGLLCAAVIPLVLAVIMSFQLQSFTPGALANRPIDHHKYVFMAEHPLELRTAPFCYRLLVPSIVSILGVPTQMGFWIISVAAMTLASILVYSVARKIGLAEQDALIGSVCLLSIGPVLRMAMGYYPSVDPMAWCLIALGTLMIVQRREYLFAVVLTFGALVKEPVFFLVALHYGWSATRLIDVRAALKSMCLALGGLIVFVSLRLLMPPLNNDPDYLRAFGEHLTQVQLGTSRYELGWLFEHVGRPRLSQMATLKFWYDMTISAFGPLFLVIIWSLWAQRDLRDMLLRSTGFFVLCFLPILVARATVRMVIVASPIIALAFAWGLSRMEASFGIRSGRLALLPVIQLVAVAFLPPREERVLSFKQTVVVITVMGALIVTMKILSGCRRAEKRGCA